MLVHHPRLEHIEGAADEGGGQPADERRDEARGERLALAEQALRRLLRVVVRGDPRAVDDDRALHVGQAALVEGAQPALRLPDRGEGVGSAGVPRRASLQLEAAVRLQPHLHHVGRVGKCAREAACQGARGEAGPQRRVLRLGVGVQRVSDVGVRSEAEAAVARLAQHRGGEAIVEGEQPLSAHDTRAHREDAELRRAAGDQLVLQLHSRLQEVKRQAETVGDAAAGGGADERLELVRHHGGAGGGRARGGGRRRVE
mmetsp:Transcript_24368/g.60455  ORF Transcript_24368/g.60455 Transcript_24368/m.60455 type:complete len:257 (-) Transcript_24368:79-849(-)